MLIYPDIHPAPMWGQGLTYRGGSYRGPPPLRGMVAGHTEPLTLTEDFQLRPFLKTQGVNYIRGIILRFVLTCQTTIFVEARGSLLDIRPPPTKEGGHKVITLSQRNYITLLRRENLIKAYGWSGIYPPSTLISCFGIESLFIYLSMLTFGFVWSSGLLPSISYVLA